MSAPILGGMANFANNFTKAYGSEKRRLSDEEERQAEREWRNEQRANQRNEWQEQNQLKTALKDAGAVRNVEQGTVVDAQTGAGPMQRTFTQNPEEASRVKAMMDAEAEMTGAAPAMAQQGTAITGKMSQGHQISTGPAAGPMAKMADPNSSEEVGKRTAQAYRQNGQIDKAMQLENAIMDQQAKRLGMDIDQLKFADMQTNRALESALKSGSTWYEGAAKFVTDLQSAGMKDVKAEYQLSPDGKSVTLFAVMPDGQKHATGTYPADESGKSQFMDKFAALPVEKRMEIMRDKLKSDREDRKVDITERRVEISEKAQQAQERKIDALIFGGGGGGRGGGLGGGRGNSEGGQTSGGLPDPMGGFDSKKAYAASVEMAVAEMSQPGKDGKAASPEAIARRATELYRAMEGQFQTTGVAQLGLRAFGQSARQAQTPSDLATLYQQGLQAGMTPAQMVSLEPRLSQLAQPKQEKASVTTQEQKPRFQSMAGAIEKPAYSPPANSPAGKAAANRAAKELESMQKMQATKDAALAAIQSGDPMAADAVRGMPGFLSLPTEQKAQIQKIIFGR